MFLSVCWGFQSPLENLSVYHHHVYHTINLSIYLYIIIHISVHHVICLGIYLFISIFLFIYLPLYPFILCTSVLFLFHILISSIFFKYIYPYIYLSIFLSEDPSLCPSVCLLEGCCKLSSTFCLSSFWGRAQNFGILLILTGWDE